MSDCDGAAIGVEARMLSSSWQASGVTITATVAWKHVFTGKLCNCAHQLLPAPPQPGEKVWAAAPLLCVSTLMSSHTLRF